MGRDDGSHTVQSVHQCLHTRVQSPDKIGPFRASSAVLQGLISCVLGGVLQIDEAANDEGPA